MSITRRQLLYSGGAIGVAGAVGAVGVEINAFRRKYSTSRLLHTPRSSQLTFSDLRNKCRTSGLVPDEARRMIIEGNAVHVSRLSDLSAGFTNLSRHIRGRKEKIDLGRADYLVFTCSDSRVICSVPEFYSKVGIEFRLAGNVMPRPENPSDFAQVISAFRKINVGGSAVVLGHCNCGAVAAHNSHVSDAELADLLALVSGTTPEENATVQTNRLREMFERQALPFTPHNLMVGMGIHDWTRSRFQEFEGFNSILISDLLHLWEIRQRREFVSDPGLATFLARPQKPHTVGVCTYNLPYGIATVCDTKQGEIFTVTGGKEGLGVLEIESLLYAFDHLGTKHLAFFAPGSRADQLELVRMFENWSHEQHIRRILLTAEVKLSMFRYDLDDGKLYAI